MAKRPKRPRDPNQLVALTVAISVGDVPNDSPKGPDSPAMEAGVSDHVWALAEIARLAEGP